MLDEQDIYICFRTVQGSVLNRPYRIPKDWNNHFENKMKPEQRETLRKMKRYLATTWSNVDLEKYFMCGFELYKGFSYHQFFNPQVINLYITKQKNLKRKCSNIKADFVESAKYVKKKMIELKINTLKEYCGLKNGFQYLAVEDYIKGKINQYFFGYLIYSGCLSRNVFDDDQIQEIVQKWSNLRNEIIDNISFFKKVKGGIENMSIQHDENKAVLNDEEPKDNLLLGTKELKEVKEEEENFQKNKLIE